MLFSIQSLSMKRTTHDCYLGNVKVHKDQMLHKYLDTMQFCTDGLNSNIIGHGDTPPTDTEGLYKLRNNYTLRSVPRNMHHIGY